jgi:carbamate kinase
MLLRAAYPDWTLVEDAGRGFRRVVASPLPQDIIELGAIKALIAENYCVIAAGGGGIPVIESDKGLLEGIDAVIDKDFASAFLSHALQADVFIISTGVKEVCLNFGKADQKRLNNIKASEARRYMEDGHFAPGSMAPKIKAALDFLDRGGKEVIITSPENLKEAVLNGAGTHITRD